MKKAFLFLTAMCFATASWASTRGPGLISDLQIEGDYVVFAVSGPAVDMPACVVWQRMYFTLGTASSQAKLAYLLSAQARGKLVTVYGTGACAPDHEEVRSVRDGE
ncbi:hypothetical protein M2336_001043 [Sphingobium sp. B1D7B]|uniref:hypothetical protein n=1 Tax=Sphingobium sp. B1D7B TaxID=2940578 RepID=UPI00222574DE|nr:hypothetical protein [Sphingobium sp. B1D7B]MCW2404414.1 hypothetical protein [Sphingobium sp. B1D7B]